MLLALLSSLVFSLVSARINYFYIPQKLDYPSSQQYCKQQGYAGLAVIPDATTNQKLLDFLRTKSQVGFGSVWVGGQQNGRINESNPFAAKWRWTDGTKMTYNHWGYGEPNNGGTQAGLEEDCVEFIVNGGDWNDAACSKYMPYVCGASPTDPNAEFVYVPTWKDFAGADAHCRSVYGAPLVSIHSLHQNAALVSYLQRVAPSTQRVWIGAYQNLTAEARNVHLNWEWLDGTPFNWTNWNTGEPNDAASASGEDCVEIYTARVGKWNDQKCTNKLAFICGSNSSNQSFEIVTSTKLNFWDSEAHCLTQFGEHLFSISSPVIAQEVWTAIGNLPITVSHGSLWIGAFQKENATEYKPNAFDENWEWVNGQPIVYSNWAPGEPNDWSGENCLEFYVGWDGRWNDLSCAQKRPFVCYISTIGPGHGGPPTPQPTVYGEELFAFVENTMSLNVREASTYCNDFYKDPLVSISDGYVNFLVLQYLYKLNLYGKVLIGAIAPLTATLNAPLKYAWLDGEPFKYDSFDTIPRSDMSMLNETCLAFDSSRGGIWTPVRCASQLPFLCWKNKPKVLKTMRPTAPAPTTKLQSLFTYVHDLKVKNHTAAEAYCRIHHNRNLVSIHSLAENDQLFEYLLERGLTYSVMIGGVQKTPEQKFHEKWKWRDGTPFLQTFWAPGEPNANALNEDCLMVSAFGVELRDVDCARINLPFLCWADGFQPNLITTRRPITSTAAYRLVTPLPGTSLDRLDVECLRLYGTTGISIYDDNERQLVRKFLASNKIGGSVGVGGFRNTSLRASVTTGWEWSDQTRFDYTNWAQGEPNQRGEEDCVQYLINQKGKWNDHSCDSFSVWGFVCAGPGKHVVVPHPTSAPTVSTSAASSGSDSHKSSQTPGAIIFILVLIIVCLLVAGGYMYWRSKKVSTAVVLVGDVEEDSIEQGPDGRTTVLDEDL